ncbi:MAG: hypothetical protein U9O89_04810 [Thermoproteota archaeon]|nr:hypothetical protein [Thermoproteota archaeon]
MANVVLEHVILLPLLVLQILFFPFATTLITSSWEGARRQVALEEAASHLGSTIQQLYFSLSEEKICTGNITQASKLPPTIEGHAYNATGSPMIPSNGSKILTLSLVLEGTHETASVKVTLGPNAQWGGGTFRSNSPNACIKVQKRSYNVLRFYLEGG